jgi:hypothetical protein
MNKISKVAAGALLAALTITSINAESKLVFGGDENNASAGYTIYTDVSGRGQDVNLTFIPKNIDATQASSFRMVFTNGGFDETKIIMCVGNTRVGNMYSKGDGYTSGLLTEPRFQFDSDANETLIKRDSNISFYIDDACSKLPTISSADGNCKTVSAKIDSGRTSTGLDYSDYNTNTATIGKTAQAVKISCQTPVCFIDSTKGKKEYGNSAPSGINQPPAPAASNYNPADFTCYDCDETPATVCKAVITIKNEASDFNISGYDFTANLVDATYVGDVTVDSNASDPIAYTMGTKVSFTGLNIYKGHEQNLTITYTPDKTTELTPGTVIATLDGFDSNLTTTGNDVKTKWENKTITNIQVAGKTQFVVPYMNASMKSFVRIATSSTVATALEADITDNDGNTCHLTLDDIPANGASVVWAHNLKAAAETAGCTLSSDLYSVQFTTDGAATVVSYMRTRAGERTVNPF